jgi:hypothetical protein
MYATGWRNEVECEYGGARQVYQKRHGSIICTSAASEVLKAARGRKLLQTAAHLAGAQGFYDLASLCVCVCVFELGTPGNKLIHCFC